MIENIEDKEKIIKKSSVNINEDIIKQNNNLENADNTDNIDNTTEDVRFRTERITNLSHSNE